MNLILIIVQIVASVGLVVLILMQQGKGADAGASFGAGASQTFFGSAGSANAVTKLTAFFAFIFFVASLSLAYVAREGERTGLQKELTEQLAPGVSAGSDAANTGLAPVEDSGQVDENVDLAPQASEPQETAPAGSEAALKAEAGADAEEQPTSASE